jgi:hypothetical protein
MKAGIGYANHQEAFRCGQLAAEQALRSGAIDQPSLALVFCAGSLDAHEFHRGLLSRIGQDVPLLGGSAIGVITREDLSYSGYPGGVAILQMEGPPVRTACATGVDKNEFQAGRRLAQQLADGNDGQLCLMFYDSVKSPLTNSSPPVMNASPPLIKGMEEVLGPRVSIVGAGLLGDHAFGLTHSFCNSYVGQQWATGTILPGGLTPYVRIMHGCMPKDGIYHTITRIEGPVIFEIDGKPAAEFIDAIYGDPHWRAQNPVKRLAIGINHGAKFADYREDVFVNRLIVGACPSGSGIILFEPDLQTGTEILFMLRDGTVMIESARRNARELMETVRRDGRRPGFGLYIDCAGRTAAYSGTLTEEAAEVQAVFKEHRVPLLGFYSGVEVAPLLGQSRGLDWTGVLLLLTEG